jgi:hypothetical protein
MYALLLQEMRIFQLQCPGFCISYHLVVTLGIQISIFGKFDFYSYFKTLLNEKEKPQGLAKGLTILSMLRIHLDILFLCGSVQ